MICSLNIFIPSFWQTRTLTGKMINTTEYSWGCYGFPYILYIIKAYLTQSGILFLTNAAFPKQDFSQIFSLHKSEISPGGNYIDMIIWAGAMVVGIRVLRPVFRVNEVKTRARAALPKPNSILTDLYYLTESTASTSIPWLCTTTLFTPHQEGILNLSLF